MHKEAADIDTSWALRPAARRAREVILARMLWPIARHYTTPEVKGAEIFDGIKRPVIFAANHSSHIDTPLILGSLPTEWRKRTVAVAAADHFFSNKVIASLVALSFGAVPIERRGRLSKITRDRFHKLFDDGWSVLLYPEGTRTRTGTMGKLHHGASLFAIDYGIPLLPIHLSGTYQAMPPGSRWPCKHPVTIHFGAPLYAIPGENYRSMTARLQDALIGMGARIE